MSCPLFKEHQANIKRFAAKIAAASDPAGAIYVHHLECRPQLI
jgi:hypothetical protein